MGKTYSRDFLVGLYTTMVQIRACEESLIEPILSGEVRCPVHLCSGQEAIAAGVCAALDEHDVLFGTHRSHGHYLAKGGSLQGLVSEVYCKEDGCARGRGGSMHLVAADRGVMGAAPIVAGTISLAVGAALASVIRGESRVAVAFFGDGAVGEGVLCESLNFAALRKLPVLFVCENNLYSTHLRIDECRVGDSIVDVAPPFGVEAVQEDGNDVIAVYEAARRAAGHCRGGDGPVFLELKTYRQRGHVGPDDNVQGSHTDIRPPSEIEEWATRDPIPRLAEYLKRQESVPEDELAAIRRRAADDARRAVEKARAAESPNGQELLNHVF